MLLKDLQKSVPQVLKGYYNVEEKQKNGKKYLVATFTDLCGEIAYCTIFNNNISYNIYKNCPNSYCECEIVYNGENNGYKQYVFSNVKPLLDPNKGQLGDVSKLRGELLKYVNSIQNTNLREVTSKILDENMEKFIIAPASKKSGYSYQSGLLVETVRVCNIISLLSDMYNSWSFNSDNIQIGLSYDALIAAAIIGEVGLINYYEIDKNEVNVTLYGRLMGKHTATAFQCDSILKKYLSTKQYTLLTHMILTNNSKSYNVGNIPRTPEAELLASIKELDKCMSNIEYLLRIPTDDVTVKLNNKEYCLESFDE